MGGGCHEPPEHLKEKKLQMENGGDDVHETAGDISEGLKEGNPTILSYYHDVPLVYVKYLREMGVDYVDSSDARDKLIGTHDSKNYYIKVEQAGVDSYTELALFLANSGKHVLAISSIVCAPGCDSEFILLQKNAQGEFEQVTADIVRGAGFAQGVSDAITEQLEGNESGFDGGKFEYVTLHSIPQLGARIPVHAQVTEPELFQTEVLYELVWNATDAAFEVEWKE